MRLGRSCNLLGFGAILLAAGCRDLSHFSTRPGQAYCGSLVNAPPPGGRGFVPSGTTSLGMRVLLDASALNTSPGIVTTDDAGKGLCSPDPLFKEAPLRAVTEAQHDAVSLLEFGDGREYNGLVWVDACESVGTMLGVLSLMKSGRVELRLFRPGPADSSGFAEFELTRREGQCF